MGKNLSGAVDQGHPKQGFPISRSADTGTGVGLKEGPVRRTENELAVLCEELVLHPVHGHGDMATPVDEGLQIASPPDDEARVSLLAVHQGERFGFAIRKFVAVENEESLFWEGGHPESLGMLRGFREGEQPGRDVGAVAGAEADSAIGWHPAGVLVRAAMPVFDKFIDRLGLAGPDQRSRSEVHSHPGHPLSLESMALDAD